jgi:hypothetical protein
MLVVVWPCLLYPIISTELAGKVSKYRDGLGISKDLVHMFRFVVSAAQLRDSPARGRGRQQTKRNVQAVLVNLFKFVDHD